MEDVFVHKEYKCPSNLFLFLLDEIYNLFIVLPVWIWKRIRSFNGKIVKIEIFPYMDTGNFAVSAILVKDEEGIEKWHNVFYYPAPHYFPFANKPTAGNIVKRSFPGRLKVLKNEKYEVVGRIY